MYLGSKRGSQNLLHHITFAPKIYGLTKGTSPSISTPLSLMIFDPRSEPPPSLPTLITATKPSGHKVTVAKTGGASPALLYR